MFRGLSSWLGLKQPEGAAAEGEPLGGDELSSGGSPPEERSEPPAEPTEYKQQPSEDPELLHQAKGFGSESPPGREGGLGGGAGMPVCERGVGPPGLGN